MAIEITGSQFNPRTIKRFVQKQFESQGLAFSGKEPELSRRLVRESGSSLAHFTLFLKSGLKLKMGIKFGVEEGKILPKTKGLIYSAKLGGSMIPLAKPKGEDYDWTVWIKKISEFVKKKEEKAGTKPPIVSRARATDNKVPTGFKAKLEAKKSELEEKKKELGRQNKLLEDQDKENTKLEAEIGGFKSAQESTKSGIVMKLSELKEKYKLIGQNESVVKGEKGYDKIGNKIRLWDGQNWDPNKYRISGDNIVDFDVHGAPLNPKGLQ